MYYYLYTPTAGAGAAIGITTALGIRKMKNSFENWIL